MPEPEAVLLSSWKEIAAYLGRGRRTVQRWEKELGLPVTRIGSRLRGTVLAKPSEIDAWLKEGRRLSASNISGAKDGSALQKNTLASASDTGPSLAVDEMLWENREILDLITEHGHQAFAVFDREMRYIRASRRWITEWGLDDIGLVGMSQFHLFPEQPDGWKTMAERCLKGETVSSDEGRFHTDGRRRSYRWAMCPWFARNGEIGGLVCFLIRTDAHRHMTKALRDLEERYRALLAATGMGVVIIDADGAIREYNSDAIRILRTTADELKGLSVQDPRWQVLGPKGVLLHVDQYPALIALRSAKPQVGTGMSVRGPRGQVVRISATCQPIFRTGNSSPHEVMVAFSEVPEHRGSIQDPLGSTTSANDATRKGNQRPKGAHI